MKLLFLFLDGVGLGASDPGENPFARARMPNLEALLGGRKLVADSLGEGSQPRVTERATLSGLDATLGVGGPPQSASGQAAILTGVNVPAVLGQHYGPKPNPEIIRILERGTLFHKVLRIGRRASLLNAYPRSYFEAIESGRRLPGAIAYAAIEAGIPLKTTADLFAGQAISADFTGQGWRERLNIPDTPLLSRTQAGGKLAQLARETDFSFFEYWLSDYAGHRADLEEACRLLESFDETLGGLLKAWRDSDGLILITSDHGNLEDLNSRKHTRNPVPALVIGDPKEREAFTRNLTNLTAIAPAVLRFFQNS